MRHTHTYCRSIPDLGDITLKICSCVDEKGRHKKKKWEGRDFAIGIILML